MTGGVRFGISRIAPSLNILIGGIVEQIVNITDDISVPDCATTGTVKDIQDGGEDAISPNSMLIYEIETPQGMMRVPGDWLARLIKPA